MTPLKGILFDLDQTLCNSEDYALGSYCKSEENSSEKKVYEFLKSHLKIVSWEKFKEIYFKSRAEVKEILEGRGASHSRYLYIQRTLENFNFHFRPDLIWEATNVYWSNTIRNMSLFPSVIEVLKIVKRNHISTALITDLTADIQIRKLKKLGINKYIDYLITSEEAAADKPARNQVDLALNKMKLHQDEVVIVGNNPKTDIELANRMNIKSVLYDFDKIHNDSKNKADFYTIDFLEILQFLEIEDKKYSNDKLVVFDLIGTLTTEPHIISKTLSKLITQDSKKIRKLYEDYKVDHISREAFWSDLEVDADKTEAKFLSEIAIRDGAGEVLENLKSAGHKLAILSNIPKEWGRAIIQKQDVGSYFDEIVFSGDHKTKKPDPKLYKILLDKFKAIDPENVYYIDDDLGDLAAAKNYLMKTIWLKSEADDIKFIPDYLVARLSEIATVLN